MLCIPVLFRFTLFPAFGKAGRGNLVQILNTLRSPFTSEFWRHCVFSGGTQHALCLDTKGEEMKIIMHAIAMHAILYINTNFFICEPFLIRQTLNAMKASQIVTTAIKSVNPFQRLA